MRNPCYTRTYALRFEELMPALEWWTERDETEAAWYVPKDDVVARNYSLDFRNPHRSENEFAGPTAIVAAIKHPLDQANDSLRELVDKAKELEPLLNGRSTRTCLGSFLHRTRNEATVVADSDYRQITVKLYGKGIVLRQVLPGCDIRTRPQFIATAGQLIMSRIDARNGAFGIVPPELDGGLVTQDFPLFDIDASVVEPEFLALLLSSEQFLEACTRSSRGTTNRKRLKENLFLAESVPVPPLDIQKEAVALLRVTRTAVNAVLDAAKIADDATAAIANYVFE